MYFCTCPYLRNNSTTHIHQPSHTQKRGTTRLAVIHALMHLTCINQIPLLSRQTTNHCAFLFLCIVLFYSLTAGQNIVQTPPTHTAATTLAGASCPLGHLRGQKEICYSDTLSAIYQRANTSGNIPCHVPDWLALNKGLGQESVCEEAYS